MPQKSPHFYWLVPENGFEWRADKTNNRLTLCLKEPAGEFRVYHPLKTHSGLIQEFARLNVNQDDMLRFANHYGNLSNINSSKQTDTENPCSGESFQDWENEILSVRQVLELWQMASTKDYRNLNEYINWTRQGILISNIFNPMHQDNSATFVISTESADLSNSGKITGNNLYLPVTERTFANFNKTDPRKPVLYLIQHIANFKIKDLIKPCLMLDDHRNSLNIKMKPKSLLGALWLQCLMAIDQQKHFAMCCTCSSWFELPENVVRKGRKYCSDACKSKAYRQRKKQKVA